MLTRREALAATALAALFVAPGARAQDRLNVIASFSILGDFVKNVGGDRVEVATLVGPNGNAHVYAPSPGDAKKVADAKLVFVNGLGFEGWLERLVKASGTKAPIVVATKGIKPLERGGEHGHDHDHGRADPHAWQSVANAKIYVANIRDALIAADPAGKRDRPAPGRADRARNRRQGRRHALFRRADRRQRRRHHLHRPHPPQPAAARIGAGELINPQQS